MSTPLYFGKYRAIVVDVADPQQRGRIRVRCPNVLGESKSSWCETCVPVAGDNEGDFCLPAVGETVWVEFEQGNANKPILTGSWYSSSKSPKHDYGDAPNERIISFKGTIIKMRQGKCTTSTANSQTTMQQDHFTITTDRGNTEVDVAKDDIKLSVDGGQVTSHVKKDEINFDFKSGNCTGKVSQDLIELVAADKTSKITMSPNSIKIEAGGVSCNLTPGSIATWKTHIGG